MVDFGRQQQAMARDKATREAFRKYLGREPSDADVTEFVQGGRTPADIDNIIRTSEEAGEYKIQQQILKEEDATQTGIDSLQDRGEEFLGDIRSKRDTLFGETQARGQEFLADTKEGNRLRLQAFSDILEGRESRLFAEDAPDILESLNSRGLVHSSGVGEEFADRRGELASQSQEALAMRSLENQSIESQLAGRIQDQLFGIQNQGLGFEQQFGSGMFSDINALEAAGRKSVSDLDIAGIERFFSLQDQETQKQIAKQTAKANQQNALISGGLDFAGGFIPGLDIFGKNKED